MKPKILLLYSSLEEGAPFPRLIKIGKPKYIYTEVNGKKQKKMFLNQFACLQKYSIIRSNVGGWKFTTTLINLCPENRSVLKRMFSDGFTISRDSKGAFLLIEKISISTSSLIIYVATQLALMIFCSMQKPEKGLLKKLSITSYKV